MRKLSIVFCFLAALTTAKAQLVPSAYIASNGRITILNDSITGTSANLLVSETNTFQAITAGANSTSVVGIAISGSGVSGSSIVQVSGIAPCIFDNPTHYNDTVIPSVTPGECHAVSDVTSGQIIGHVFSATSLPSTVKVSLIQAETPILHPTINGLMPVEGGTGITSYKTGDVIVATAPNTLGSLHIGGPGTCVSTLDGLTVGWHACGGGGAGGSVISVSTGGLVPLFSSTVANQFTTPNITFNLLNAANHTFLGNHAGSTGPPSYIQPAFTDISGTLVASQFGPLTGDVTTSSYAATVVKINGTSVPTNSAADQLLGTTASATAAWLTGLTTCGDGTHALAYNTSTHTFSCQALSAGSVTTFTAGALSPVFTTSVANGSTAPALTFTLSTAANHTFLGNNSGSTAVPSYVQPAFPDITGLLAGAQLPTFSGDVTNVNAVLTVTQINGTSVPINGAADQVLGTTASSVASWLTGLSTCGDSNHALGYNTTNHSFSCQTLSGTGGGGGTITSLSVGGLSPVFTSNITNPTTTPAISFTLLNAANHTFLGNHAGSTGAPSYIQPTFPDISGTLAGAQLPTITGDVSNSSAIFTVNKINGTSVPTNAAADQVLGTTASATGAWLTGLTTCGDSSHALAYNTSTHAFSCQTLTTGGTVSAFTAGTLSPIFTTSVATNTTTPALTFVLSNAGAHAFLGNNTGSSAPPAYVQPAFPDISGTLAGSQLPAFTGDVTNSSAAMTVARINGTSVPINSAADQVLGTTASATGAWLTGLTTCGDNTHALAYNASTHAFSCQTIAPGGTTGANFALSNLAAVAINLALVPGVAGTLPVGSATLPWTGLYVGNAANNTAFITGTFSANRTFTIPDVANSVAVALPANGGTNQYATAIASNGVVAFSTVNFTNLQGSIALTQTPLTTLGDLLYVNGTPALTRLAGNITTTKKYLSQTGTSVISAAPVWSQIAAADLSNGTTGSGALVLATSPTLVTPILGVAAGTTLSLTGQLTSTVSTGTAPFIVASTTLVTNLNANFLQGVSWANPLAIGSTTPAAGAFTDLQFSNDLRSSIAGCSPASTGSIRLCGADNITVRSQDNVATLNVWDKVNGSDVQQFGDSAGTYFPGPMNVLKDINPKTTNYTLLAAETAGFFDNTGATGEVDFTLPACSTGLYYTFYIDNAQTEKIIASNGALIRYGSTLGAVNGNLSAAMTGNLLELQCIGTSGADAAPEWVISKTIGSWTIN